MHRCFSHFQECAGVILTLEGVQVYYSLKSDKLQILLALVHMKVTRTLFDMHSVITILASPPSSSHVYLKVNFVIIGVCHKYSYTEVYIYSYTAVWSARYLPVFM